MAHPFRPTPSKQSVIQTLKDAIRTEDTLDYVSLSHRVPVRPVDGGVPVTVTIEISRDPDGLSVATCHEFSEVFIAGEGERDVLVRAELEIRHLLAAPGVRPRRTERCPQHGAL